MSRLEVNDITLSYGSRGAPSVVDGLTADIADGKVTAIVGANACGKSTLLRGMARLLRPQSGAVLLDGQTITSRPTREVAKVLGLLPQSPITPEGVTVADLVGRGRQPHQGILRRWTSHDDRVVADAMTQTDTLDLADRQVDELSGGQRQRVWIAMALAQQTDLLLLDEPTTYLDIAHQIEILDLLADLNERRGTTIVMVLHELNLAARYAHHLIAMNAGAIAATGEPRDVITEQRIRDVFHIDAHIVTDPVHDSPMIVPISAHRPTSGLVGAEDGEEL